MIDQEGIKSLEKGASNIRLTGNEGESSPIQEQLKKNMSESFPMREYMEEFERVFPDMIPLRGTEEYNDALEDYFRGLVKGPVLPSDEDPINPFGPRPIGPPLPDRQMAAFGGIMGLDQRKQYGIGSSLKKALRKVTRPFTKVAQKIVPKEAAGILRMAAPFMGPIAGPLAYLGGTAKQRGRISPLDLALTLAPTVGRMKLPMSGRFSKLVPEGLRGDTVREALGKTPLPFSDKNLGEFLVGEEAGTRKIIGRQDKYGIPNYKSKSEMEAFYETLSPAEQARFDRLNQDIYGDFFPGEGGIDDFTDFESPEKFREYERFLEKPTMPSTIYKPEKTGFFGKAGEMFKFGKEGGPGILETKVGQSLFGSKQEDGTFKPSILKLGSWGMGIAANIKAKKYRNEIEAADAAEDALLAENAAASEVDIQTARDWAKETFSKLTIADFAVGGRINKAMGGLSSLQTQPSDVTPPGMELDLRGGGFIPIGKAEKADDVPARVSKNEFVFTADAVKAAGGGSVNEGAKKMYDTMKRLESQVG